MQIVKQVKYLVKKEMLLEWRSKYALNGVLPVSYTHLPIFSIKPFLIKTSAINCFPSLTKVAPLIK